MTAERQREKPEFDKALNIPCFRQDYETAEAFVETADFLETALPGAPVSLTLAESASEKVFVIPATDDRLQPN